MDIMKVIKERRSVRKYKKDAIPDGIIADIIDAARVAPSWANTQVCQYIIVKDQKIKELLSDALIPATNPAKAALIDAPVKSYVFLRREAFPVFIKASLQRTRRAIGSCRCRDCHGALSSRPGVSAWNRPCWKL